MIERGGRLQDLHSSVLLSKNHSSEMWTFLKKSHFLISICFLIALLYKAVNSAPLQTLQKPHFQVIDATIIDIVDLDLLGVEPQ